MSTISPDSLLAQLKWRYATKAFDAAKSIPADLWIKLEEALILAPSSWGLQPWHFVVVTDPARKAELRPIAWNQAQITDCSHLVVFCIRKNIDEAYVQKFIDRNAHVRGGPADALEGYKHMMIGDIVRGPRSFDVNQWSARQLYLALGSFLTSAALLGVDVCPMEGFDPAKLDHALKLAERGLASMAICACGYRSPHDKYAHAPKVRFNLEDMVERI